MQRDSYNRTAVKQCAGVPPTLEVLQGETVPFLMYHGLAASECTVLLLLLHIGALLVTQLGM